MWLKQNDYEILQNRTSKFILYVLSSLMNGIYILIWIVVQYFVKQCLSYLDFTDDLYVLISMRVLFAISTIYPIIINIGKDFKMMISKQPRNQENQKTQKI